MFINHNLWMTLTYFTARLTQVAHAFKWGKLLKCHLKGKNMQEMANELKIFGSEKRTTGVGMPPSRGNIHVCYMTEGYPVS